MKMFDSRKQNPNCNFAEELVSYIYDEMNSSEKTSFETHLVNCTPCVDEIAAFNSVSFSIKEWRDEEFAVIETPQISIPYEVHQLPLQVAQTEEHGESWFGSIIGLFNFSPALLKTATAFGTLALAMGLAWFLFSSPSVENNSLAENGDKESKDEISSPGVSEQKEIPNEQEIVNNDEIDNKVEDIKPKQEIAVSTPNSNRNQANVNNRIVKIKNTPKKVNKKSNRAVNKSKSSPVKNDQKPKKQDDVELREIPRLTDFAMEDTDDTDFRLIDFSEDGESGD